jgi:ribonuclease HII
MSGRDEAGRGATRQAGIGRALPTGWSGRDEVGRGPPGPRPVHSSSFPIEDDTAEGSGAGEDKMDG